jgi:exopolyphosphatase / guanosine-5'-triphosphate,3'-diphosphate pyrophosphatase
VVCACIDIGSNTTRLLVGECLGDRVRPRLEERAFTRLGAGMPVPPERVEEIASAVAWQVARARAAGAECVRLVATAGVRRAVGAPELVAALEAAASAPVDVIGEEEEARLAFRGATCGLAPSEGPVAVVDVGGGSSEVAVGVPGSPPSWWASLPIGSAVVASTCAGDPPHAASLAGARAEVRAAWAGVEVPACARAVAVGGSATSLRRLAGAVLAPEPLERALARVVSAPAADVAARTGLDRRRVALLPAGILLLIEASRRLGRPLEVGAGGLREGVLLELASASSS